MPKGGFGNLIALPLQGQARKNNNSVFVNSDFVPYEDQWSFLASVKKIDENQLTHVISKLCQKSELGALVSDSDEKPWEAENKSISAFDFPREMNIVESNMIYVPLNGLSSVAINSIKRLAAFKNPDFYRAQAMRMPVYNKPRVICLAEETDDYIAIPRGCKNALCSLLNKSNVDYYFCDKTNCGQKIDVSFNGTLREEQKPAAKALLENNIGVLSATTAFGKTVIGAYLIGQRKTNTLILVHTQSLMVQWKTSLEKFLNINIEAPEVNGRGRRVQWSPIGLIGGGKNTLHGCVDVAVMQSLLDDGDVKELVRNYRMIIVDECHHVSAVNFESILKFANAKYVYGLTATPTRHDGHHPIIFMQCGEIKYRVDAKNQAEKRDFEHFLIPRFTSFRKSYENGTLISQIYSDLTLSELRNKKIVSDVENAIRNGRTPIILTERRDHAEKLNRLLLDKCDNLILLTGNASQKERRIALEELNSVSEGESLIVIATGKYAGEGFDFPRLDTLFLALPIAWKGKVAQYAGRLHRDYPNKKEVLIYDYVDIRIPVLERMYHKRLKGYSSIGYKTKIEVEDNTHFEIIYDGKSYQSVYKNDLNLAFKEIIIASPYVQKSKINNLTPLFREVMNKGVKIIIITRPCDDFEDENRDKVIENIALLESIGVIVKTRSDLHQKFTVIDSKLVWYGSVNFMSYNKDDESLMRFESSDIAGELCETVM